MHSETIERACQILRAARPRLGAYAYSVLCGRRAWSGADLQGKARKYSGTYYRARLAAEWALIEAGGCTVRLKKTGRIIGAVPVGPDEFGDILYFTQGGILRPDMVRA